MKILSDKTTERTYLEIDSFLFSKRYGMSENMCDNSFLSLHTQYRHGHLTEIYFITSFFNQSQSIYRACIADEIDNNFSIEIVYI